MKIKANLITICGLIAFSLMSLMGCSKNNPIVSNKDAIQHFKFLLSLDNPSFPSLTCANYYANSMSDSSKEDICDKWSKQTYKSQQEAGIITTDTTLDDFRDPKVWQKVLLLKQ